MCLLYGSTLVLHVRIVTLLVTNDLGMPVTDRIEESHCMFQNRTDVILAFKKKKTWVKIMYLL